ncbi:MAG: SRPBCC domain-containing protein [Acidimicrobiia bacterium]|nr:SRPBCC domain-containing protein [Acidimicrobiia bacterium]
MDGRLRRVRRPARRRVHPRRQRRPGARPLPRTRPAPPPGFLLGTRRFRLAPARISTVEITLEPTGDGTRLHVEHRDLPPQEAEMHAIGWPHFLARLAIAATGQHPGPDPFATTPPPRPTNTE